MSIDGKGSQLSTVIFGRKTGNSEGMKFFLRYIPLNGGFFLTPNTFLLLLLLLTLTQTLPIYGRKILKHKGKKSIILSLKEASLAFFR